MNNLVSLNNNIFHHIVRCFNSQYWSRFTHTELYGVAHKRVGLVFNEQAHCFQSYNQGYRKTSNN